MIKVKNNKKGFTLLELVIAIGLLSLFAVFYIELGGFWREE